MFFFVILCLNFDVPILIFLIVCDIIKKQHMKYLSIITLISDSTAECVYSMIFKTSVKKGILWIK
jgi:nucleoside phosphorylase